MDLMKSIYRINWGALFLLFTLVGCKGSDVPVPEKEGMPIRWNVIPEGMQEGRALINSTMNLQTACSTGGQTIGIWSAYEQGTDYQENVLGNETGDVSLIYQPTPIWYNWQGWTYGEKAAFWKHGAIHYFNAYFPMTGGLSDVQNTKTTITGNYNTETTQTDVMVTRVVVNTAVNFQGSPVELPLKHALAAIQFQFESMDKVPMKLKSFALSNVDDEGLRTSGKLAYDGTNIIWGNLGKATDAFYTWAPATSLDFTNKPVLAYTPFNEDNIYTSNAGSVLIIPQEYNGDKTKITFQIDTKSEPISVLLPAPVETDNKFLPGRQYIYKIKIPATGNRVILECNVADWVPKVEDMEFEDHVSVNEEDKLVWSEDSYQGTIDPTNAEITLAPGKLLTGEFRIATPEGATWHAEFIPQDTGSVNAFVFVHEDHTTSYAISGKVGEDVSLKIRAANASITSNKKAILRILVKTGDDRTIVVRELMPQGFLKNEYTTIQSI